MQESVNNYKEKNLNEKKKPKREFAEDAASLKLSSGITLNKKKNAFYSIGVRIGLYRIKVSLVKRLAVRLPALASTNYYDCCCPIWASGCGRRTTAPKPPSLGRRQRY
uniref:Uncharacterized protein n=1 Tax=Romanomermis culicivorax TaxID=13658 RepID=A0A915J6S2_ROMCU